MPKGWEGVALSKPWLYYLAQLQHVVKGMVPSLTVPNQLLDPTLVIMHFTKSPTLTAGQEFQLPCRPNKMLPTYKLIVRKGSIRW